MTNKMILSPMDGGIIRLIESVTGKNVDVECMGKAAISTLVFSWEQIDPVGSTPEETAKTMALKDALRGRLGDRICSLNWENGKFILIIAAEKSPVEYQGYEESTPDYTIGGLYQRTKLEVRAIQVRKDNAAELAKFTGGGEMVQSMDNELGLNGLSVYTFISENGVYIDALEGHFIVHDGNNFNVYDPGMFNYTFALK